MKLYVRFFDDFASVCTNGEMPIQVRVVEVELTPQQAGQLEPRPTGTLFGKRCLETMDSRGALQEDDE